MNFVLDCSIVIAWLHKEGPEDYVEGVLAHLESGARAIVPPLWYYEFGNGLVNAKRVQRTSSAAIDEFLETISVFDIEIVAPNWDDALIRLPEEVGLAESRRLTFYDASYLLLALQHRIPLATLDKALKKAAHISGIDDLIAAS